MPHIRQLIANPADVLQEEPAPATPIRMMNEQGPVIWRNIGSGLGFVIREIWIRYWDRSKYMKEIYNVTLVAVAYMTTEEEKVVEKIEVVELIEERTTKEGEEELILLLNIFAEMTNKLDCRRDLVQKTSKIFNKPLFFINCCFLI